jgi:hypothetical protein
MTADERDALLHDERTCRVATIQEPGPHLTALWFGWDGHALWLNFVVRSQRWTDLERDGRVSILIDSGDEFSELRGVEIQGVAKAVGEVLRAGEPNQDLVRPEMLFGEKYAGGYFVHYGRHAWPKVRPTKMVSWDFRKVSTGLNRSFGA